MTDREEFWEFSLSVYDRAGDSFLKLQDRFGFDVNLLLFCCWRGAIGRALDEAELIRTIEATAAWRANVVEPLRATRRWLKIGDHPDGVEDLRGRVLELELEGERLLQALIIKTTAPGPRRAELAQNVVIETALGNLEMYQRAAALGGETGLARLFSEMLTGIFANDVDGGIVATDGGSDGPARKTSELGSETT